MQGNKVVVCGGGVAGVMAAIAAARSGADALLLERGGCLGGMWTAGLLGSTLDSGNKKGLLQEFLVKTQRAVEESGAPGYEAEKYVLEEMCAGAGVHTLLHSSVCGCTVQNRRITSLQYISKSGLRTVEPALVIDATGDGDVAAMAGCSYDYGREDDGATQPMSMIVVVAGLCEEEIRDYISYPNRPFWEARAKVRELLESINAPFSIGCPSFQKINDSLYYLSANQEYERRSDREEDISAATFHARKELFELVRLLRQKGGHPFRHITLAATPEMIGVREGRRIHGLYTVGVQDVLHGTTHPDAVCRVNYWVDIHSLTKDDGPGFTDAGIQSKPYDIPFRALLPVDCDNLLMAGRSISGDFYAHASYRVAGNMAAVGEAAGIMAAAAVCEEKDVKSLRYEEHRPW